MNKLEELQQQLDQIQWRLDELRGEPDPECDIPYQPPKPKRRERYKVVKDDNKKIAFYAPESWMKEKVAETLGLRLVYDNPEDYIHDWVFDSGNGILDAVNIKRNDDYDWREVPFEDFCKEHGVSDKPDYVRTSSGVLKVSKWGSEGDPITKNDTETAFWNHWQPATQKEYLEQESKKIPNEKAIRDFVQVDNDSEKEPKLKLNEEWRITANNKFPSHPSNFLGGVKYMQKAIYERALEVYDVSYQPVRSERSNWQWACEYVIEVMKQGNIKPPKPKKL